MDFLYHHTDGPKSPHDGAKAPHECFTYPGGGYPFQSPRFFTQGSMVV